MKHVLIEWPGRVFSVKIGDEVGELGGYNINDGGEAENLTALTQELGLSIVEKVWSQKQRVSTLYFTNNELHDITNELDAHNFTPKSLQASLETLRFSCSTMEEVLNRLFPYHHMLRTVCDARLAAYEGAPVSLLSSEYVVTLYHILLGSLAPVHSTGVRRVSRNIEGGNSKLPEALAKFLGDRVYLNKVVCAVDKKADGSYRLHFADGSLVEIDILILAVPLPLYKDIAFDEEVLSTDDYTLIRSFPYGTTAKILAPALPSAEPKQSCTNGRLILFRGVQDVLATLYYVKNYGVFDGQTIAATYAQDEHMLWNLYKPDERYAEPVQMAKDCLDGIYHGPVGHSWVMDPYAQGSYSFIPAGYEELFTKTTMYEGELVKELFVPRSKSLFFVGEHTCTQYDIVGTMEAAVESGERMARIIQKVLNKN